MTACELPARTPLLSTIRRGRNGKRECREGGGRGGATCTNTLLSTPMWPLSTRVNISLCMAEGSPGVEAQEGRAMGVRLSKRECSMRY